MLDAIVEYARCNLILYEDTAYLQQPSRRIIKSLGCVDSLRTDFPFTVSMWLPGYQMSNLYSWLLTHKGSGGLILVLSTCVILHGTIGQISPWMGHVRVCEPF